MGILIAPRWREAARPDSPSQSRWSRARDTPKAISGLPFEIKLRSTTSTKSIRGPVVYLGAPARQNVYVKLWIDHGPRATAHVRTPPNQRCGRHSFLSTPTKRQAIPTFEKSTAARELFGQTLSRWDCSGIPSSILCLTAGCGNGARSDREFTA